MNENERNAEIMADFSAQVVAEGLGFGTGSIGVNKRLGEDAELPISADVLRKVDAAIESPHILVPVDKDDNGELIDDDGCGDGRGVRVVMQGTEVKKRSLNRPKVFGGGLTMEVAAKIGKGEAKGTLQEEFKAGITDLSDKEINFGAHTDIHAHGEKCGCGAIDRSPEIIAAAIVFRKEIEGAIELLTGQPTESNQLLNNVFSNYQSYAEKIIGQEYSGAKVMKEIIDSGKIVKQLDDDHKEVRTVLNTVKGFTPNQALIREISDEQAQIFAVDEWRIRELADKLYEGYSEDDKQSAYLSMLVYTLATAGVLTVGDLKVYAIVRNEQFATAT